MKLRLLLALLSLAAAGAAIYVHASNSNAAASTAAADSTATCPDCDGPDPAAVLPNPYKTDAAKPATAPASPVVQVAPATPAKN